MCVRACVVLLAVWLLAVDAGLTLNKKCGQKTCDDKEFCSPFDNICRPCESVCELGSHNYQEESCQKDCQDYLHDRLYIKRNEQSVENLQEDIERLYQLVIVVLIISALILLILVGVLSYAYLRARKQNGHLADRIRKKLSTINALTKENNNKDGDSENPKALYKIGDALKLDIGSAQHHGHMAHPTDPVTPATTSTTLSSRPPRYPTEDTALEYGGYDNPALTPSPVFDKGQESKTPATKRESSF